MALETVGQSVNRILSDRTEPPEPVPSVDHIVERLSKRFGSGANPRIRQSLYRRLGLLCQLHGQPVYQEICSVAAAATSCTRPDRYFCAAITRRLRELGYLSNGGEEL